MIMAGLGIVAGPELVAYNCSRKADHSCVLFLKECIQICQVVAEPGG